MGKDYKDYTGLKFGKLTVLREYSEKKNSKVTKYFDCVCDCGKEHKAKKFSTTQGITTSCGCGKREKYDEKYDKAKIGDKFNYLTVITAPVVTPNGRRADVRCDCGTVKSVLLHNVLSGVTKSCGCYNVQRLKDHPIGFKLARADWPIVCEMYTQGKTAEAIGEEFGVGADTIYRAMKLSGTPTFLREDRATRADKVIDRTRFTDYDCEYTAYYYGLLLADGCLTGRTGNTVVFNLKSTDGYMVDSLHTWLNAPTKLHDRVQHDDRTNNTYYARYMSITDHVIAANLRKLGFEERKSMREKLPQVFSHNNHFWRGMVDGDGHIGTSGWTMNLCGSFEVCNGFADYSTMLGTTRRPTISSAGSLYIASLTNKADVKIVLDALYADSNIYLHRKFNTYKERYTW